MATIKMFRLPNKRGLHLLPWLRSPLRHPASQLVLHPHKRVTVDHSHSCHQDSTLLQDSLLHRVLLVLDLQDLHLRARCQEHLQRCHQAFKLVMDVDDK